MARLGKGRANTARGAANFLRETISPVRCAGAAGPLTVRADSGFYTHPIVAAGRDPDRRPPRLTVRPAASQICARLVPEHPLLQFALIISPAAHAEGR